MSRVGLAIVGSISEQSDRSSCSASFPPVAPNRLAAFGGVAYPPNRLAAFGGVAYPPNRLAAFGWPQQ
jgi:hypothetical protein